MRSALIRHRSGGTKRGKKVSLKDLNMSTTKYDPMSFEEIQRIKENKYMDINNVNNDFSETDDMRLKVAVAEARNRMQARYNEPNIIWKKKLKISQKTIQDIEEEMITRFGRPRNFFKSMDVLTSPLNVGDVVDLSTTLETADLAVVAELPNSLDDPRYTFINCYGGIIFASRLKVKLRFPNIYPHNWFNNIILNEKTLNLAERGINPIGKPKFTAEDSLINSSTNSYFEHALVNNVDNINKFETFIIPSIPSRILARHLSNILSKSWEYLPEFNSKLELLHNLLQSSESPIHLNIFQLFHATKLIDLNKIEKEVNKIDNTADLIQYYTKLSVNISKEIGTDNNYNTLVVGKSIIGELDLFEENDLSSFYSLILSLRKNSKLYGGVNNFDPVTYFPLSITIFPLSKVVETDLTVDAFKENEGLFQELNNYLIKKLQNPSNQEVDQIGHAPFYYDKIISLMKLYCSSSTSLDPTTESFLMKILRNLPIYNDKTISTSTVYELLLKLHECAKIQDPSEWSMDLLKPYSGISEKADFEQLHYDKLDEYYFSGRLPETNDFDNVKELRQDLTVDVNSDLTNKHVIYCIDDKGAHEIDDGIALKKLDNGSFKVYTHIADPGSFLTKDDILAKIAFERGYTSYFPDTATKPIEMLPRSFVDKVQLKNKTGDKDKKTRTMCYSVIYENGKVLPDSFDIFPSYANEFVGITYDEVDLILNNDPNVLRYISERYRIDPIRIKKDLLKLYEISENLNKVRTSKIDFKFKFSNSLTKVIKDEEKENLRLIFNNTNDESHETKNKSQLLVSEIMINTNSMVAKFLSKEKIPAIYKILKQLPISDEIYAQMKTLDQNSISDTQKISTFLSGTSYSIIPSRHEYIGVDSYVTVTSPLRRFSDLVIHWQLQSYLKNQLAEEPGVVNTSENKVNSLLSEKNLSYILLSLKSKELKINGTMRKSKNFYIFKYLKDVMTSKSENPLLRAIITSKPTTSGEANTKLVDYGNINCLLKSSAKFSNKKIISKLESLKNENLNFFSTLKIGDVVEDCYIEDIDLLSGDILLKSKSY
ncbi:hypothetical protein PACTADRAFT_34097 [Pachysolen tannophilus NRRL Y-2460]|uniref:RNB domain-containing protein n=1 Tax=Pachysolen tannophilus NRRL Y-2460 TaxID=669874 RepID=A0A1E4TUW1_PACTA|nr:hypothetical protein PACTADRAFT_34097 [Pachysolen tannophilus NRRL Y-2460]